MLQERSMERRRVLLSGIAGVAWSVDGPWCPFARRMRSSVCKDERRKSCKACGGTYLG